MKFNYVKTIGFRKFKKVFETNLYDITSITGKNRSGKSNILYAIINIMLGTNLSGDDKVCLINKHCDSSYGELQFTDNSGIKHTLIRGKSKYSNKGNFIALDDRPITQNELINFYKDKKLFLSILNPLYFLSRKSAEQKEMVDKYLSDIQPKVIFDTLTEEQQNKLIEEYFYIPIKDIYANLSVEDLENIYNEHNLQEITGKTFAEILDKDKWNVLCRNIKELKGIKYFKMLSPEEQETFINQNMRNICMYIAFDNLSKKEQEILEGIPTCIPEYIKETNDSIKLNDNIITSLNGKIEYAKNIADEKLPNRKTFEKDMELTLALQELSHLNTDQKVVDKEKQQKIVADLEKDILSKESESSKLDISMKEGKRRYLAIKNGTYSLCPTCEQHIENDSRLKTISNMYKDLIAKYDRKNLLDTQIKDLKIKLSMEKCKYHSLDGNTSVKKSERIAVVEENIRRLENEKSEIEKFNNEITLKEKNIANANKDIAKFNEEKQLHTECINSLNEAKKTAQKLYILYIEEKMKLAKSYLKDVDISFYSVLRTTGELKEDFIITYKNTPLSDLSKSETIATALEFANMFNKISKSNFPIFIDDYESCADYDFIKDYSKDTQLIVSKVEKGHLLKIADYNNNDDCTIIKPVISGVTTFKTQKRSKHQIAKLQQAA